jgi:hypothetical protein
MLIVQFASAGPPVWMMSLPRPSQRWTMKLGFRMNLGRAGEQSGNVRCCCVTRTPLCWTQTNCRWGKQRNYILLLSDIIWYAGLSVTYCFKCMMFCNNLEVHYPRPPYYAIITIITGSTMVLFSRCIPHYGDLVTGDSDNQHSTTYWIHKYTESIEV